MTEDKCPSCGDKGNQQNVGQVQSKHLDKARIATTLFRCGECGFLYTVPPIEESKGRHARHSKPDEGDHLTAAGAQE
jgi:hypothetical protein